MESAGFVGIDVSASTLDVAFRPGAKRVQAKNEPRSIARLVRMIALSKPEVVALEASGGYERVLLERLLARALRWRRSTPGTCASSPGKRPCGENRRD